MGESLPESEELEMRRGDIYYVNRDESREFGHEMQAGRPAVIVGVTGGPKLLQVVYLTTQPREDLPTHIQISNSRRPSTALCEQVDTVDSARIGDYVGTCSDQEMRMIDIGLLIALGIETGKDRADEELKIKLIRTEAERDTYKGLFERLTERMG